MMFRNIANPRRTTLAHLVDGDELGPVGYAVEQPEEAVALAPQTANPRRTVLIDVPQG
jgi:hypothetical protein